MKIVVTDQQGGKHELAGKEGFSLMEIIRDGGLPMRAECGGGCSCATCHVYIDDAWFAKLPAPEDLETDMLDMALAVEPLSRLSCQISLKSDYDGLELTLAPGIE